jgi:hypothetical protein
VPAATVDSVVLFILAMKIPSVAGKDEGKAQLKLQSVTAGFVSFVVVPDFIFSLEPLEPTI